jgi:hypothetical protein
MGCSTDRRDDKCIQIVVKKHEGNLVDLSIDERIILKWIRERVRGCGPDPSGSGYGQVAGSGGNELLGSIIGGKFLG